MRFLKFGLMRLKRRFWRRNTQPEVGQYWEDKVRYCGGGQLCTVKGMLHCRRRQTALAVTRMPTCQGLFGCTRSPKYCVSSLEQHPLQLPRKATECLCLERATQIGRTAG